MWVASVSHSAAQPVVKSLHANAGSGLIFHCAGNITIDQRPLPHGVIVLPTLKTSKSMTLSAGTRLAGIHLTPASGQALIAHSFTQPSALPLESPLARQLDRLYRTLCLQTDSAAKLDILQAWSASGLTPQQPIPKAIQRALACIGNDIPAGALDQHTGMSQRQLERLFSHWLNMTPKFYHRIARVNKAAQLLAQPQPSSLAEIAHACAFSDQAHMTREFRAITHKTPGNW